MRRNPSTSQSGLGPTPLTWLAAGVLIGLLTVAVDASRRPPRPEDAVFAAEPAVDVPWTGWRQALWSAWREFNADAIPATAAGAAFFALLSLFPALGVFASLYGLVGDVGVARQQIASLAGVLPQGAVSVLSDQLLRLAATPPTSLGVAFVATLATSLWSANAGTKALLAGLNTAYKAKEQRRFFALKGVSLAFTIGAIALAVLGVAAVAAMPTVLAATPWRGFHGLGLLRWPGVMLVVLAALSMLYRYGPSRRRARRRWITPGALVAALAWMAMSVLFSIYVEQFGRFDRTYGALGAVAGLMTWIWLSFVVVLFGAELNAEFERLNAPWTRGKLRR